MIALRCQYDPPTALVAIPVRRGEWWGSIAILLCLRLLGTMIAQRG